MRAGVVVAVRREFGAHRLGTLGSEDTARDRNAAPKSRRARNSSWLNASVDARSLGGEEGLRRRSHCGSPACPTRLLSSPASWRAGEAKVAGASSQMSSGGVDLQQERPVL